MIAVRSGIRLERVVIELVVSVCVCWRREGDGKRWEKRTYHSEVMTVLSRCGEFQTMISCLLFFGVLTFRDFATSIYKCIIWLDKNVTVIDGTGGDESLDNELLFQECFDFRRMILRTGQHCSVPRQ